MWRRLEAGGGEDIKQAQDEAQKTSATTQCEPDAKRSCQIIGHTWTDADATGFDPEFLSTFLHNLFHFKTLLVVGSVHINLP